MMDIGFWLWVYAAGFTIDLLIRSVRIGVDDTLDNVAIFETIRTSFVWPAVPIMLVGYMAGAAIRIWK